MSKGLYTVSPRLHCVILPLLIASVRASSGSSHNSDSSPHDSCIEKQGCNEPTNDMESKTPRASLSGGAVLLQQKTLNTKATVVDEEELMTSMEAGSATATRSTAQSVFFQVSAVVNQKLGSTTPLSTSSRVAIVACILALGSLAMAARRHKANTRTKHASDNGETETKEIIDCALQIDGHTTCSNLTRKCSKEEAKLLSWAMNFDPDAIASSKSLPRSHSSSGSGSESEPDPETDSENSNRYVDENY